MSYDVRSHELGTVALPDDSHRRPTPSLGRWVSRLLALLTCAGALLTAGLYFGAPGLSRSAPLAPEATVRPPHASVPLAVAALSGVWEGLRPEDAPSRLVVEDVHLGWARVQYTWGAHPAGRVQPGWIRLRAKIYPEGRLFWHYPGDFTFQLADDWNTLVGTREQGGDSATVFLRRATAFPVPGMTTQDP
jgi:hypothetical protein